jgi:hypothetical protein
MMDDPECSINQKLKQALYLSLFHPLATCGTNSKVQKVQVDLEWLLPGQIYARRHLK